MKRPLALLATPVFYALLDMAVNLSRHLGIRFSDSPRPSRSAEPMPAPVASDVTSREAAP